MILYYLLLFAAIPLAVFYRFERKYYDSTPCSKDPPIDIDWKDAGVSSSILNGTEYRFHHPCKLFSSDYEEAREKFLDAVESLGKRSSANVSTFSLPVVAVGDETTPLTMDIAVIPGNAKDLGTIVHSSGLHGVEGYAGSAIQLALLEMLRSEYEHDEKGNGNGNGNGNADSTIFGERPTIVLVHALNPVGMKQYRRFNENNVDLNRNCIVISDEEARGSDDAKSNEAYRSFDEFVAQRGPNIAGYDDLRYFFVPPADGVGDDGEPSLSLYTRTVGYFAEVIPLILKHGMTKLKRALVSGQYHDPEGMNYGGQEWQSSIQNVFDFFVRDHPEFFADSASLVWIDVHTGLGPFGEDSVHYKATGGSGGSGSGSESSSDGATRGGHERVGFGFRDRALATAFSVTSDDQMASAAAFSGYELASGLLLNFLADAYERLLLRRGGSASDDNDKDSDNDGDGDDHRRPVRNHPSGVFALQEFGTLPEILVGRGLILDNILYQMVARKRQKRSRSKETTTHEHNYEDNHEHTQNDPYSYRSPFLKHAFYPQSTEWRAMVVRKGLGLILQSMQYEYEYEYTQQTGHTSERN